MATFPELKSKAVAQYPARRTTAYQNQTVRFVDGREQRYRDSAGPLRRWQLRLEDLEPGQNVVCDLTDSKEQVARFYDEPFPGFIPATVEMPIETATAIGKTKRGRMGLSICSGCRES